MKNFLFNKRKQTKNQRKRKEQTTGAVQHPVSGAGRYPDASVGGGDTDAIDWVPVCYWCV